MITPYPSVAQGNMLTKQDRNGHTISYGYDALYRLTSKSYPDQTAVNYTYDPLSRLTQVTDPTGTYSFTYDNLGRLTGTGTQYSFLSTALNNSYGYDAASNRTSFSNPQSQITNYTYDSLNRLTTLTDPNTGQFGFGYDALGRRTSLTRPNGVGTSYSYDTLSRLLSVLHASGALPGSTANTYDAAGNRLTKTAVQEASPSPVSVLSQYSYDNIYELTQAVVNSNVAESYSYDAVGNRTASAGPTSYNYNTSNELTSSSTATYTYDNNGNMTSKTDSTGTTYYAWDFENRLSSVTLPAQGGTVYFNYDPFGRRIRRVFGSATTIYAYDGDNVVQQLGGSGTLLASYTQGAGIDEPLAMYSGVPTYFHADGLGSITSLTDSSGQLAASYVYDSFGNLTASTGTITSLFEYTGREFDSETGLYYYRARQYDPSIGRFISEDPLGFGAGVNYYAYVFNNSTNFVDPLGGQTVYPHDFVGPLPPGAVRGYIVDLINNKDLSPLVMDRNKQAPKNYGPDFECVSLTRHFAPALPCTRCWRAGPRVIDNDIPQGTAIATFDENGRFSGEDKNSGLYVGGQTYLDKSGGYSVGIFLLDQFPPTHTGQVRFLPFQYQGSYPGSNSSQGYYVITVPPGTTPGGCDCAN